MNTLIDMKGHLSWVQRPVSPREDQQHVVPCAQGSDSLLLWARLAQAGPGPFTPQSAVLWGSPSTGDSRRGLART